MSAVFRRTRVLLAGLLACAASLPAAAQGTRPEPSSLFVPPRSLGTAVEPEPPRYVRPLSRTGLPGTLRIDWLDVGVDQRLRIESRTDDVRRPVAGTDTPALLRTRAYVSLRRIMDPLRLTVELQDSRRFGSDFAPDARDVNTVEPIQAYAELHLASALGRNRPLAVRVGRFAFEALDRRLISRNEWRNTTNTFQGVRAILGRRQDAWSAEVIAVQPLERRLTSLDRAEPGTWFSGAIGAWRGWSRHVTLEPFYLRLDETRDAAPGRRVHTVGVRAYGPAGTRGLDYDVSVHVQRGRDGRAAHRAWAGTSELGATLAHRWTPRLALFYGYASGDAQPGDLRDGRFERLFGFARPWSSNDYIQMENISTPKVSLELTPRRRLAIDTAYVAYWLASATDRWALAALRDPTP